ncbi:MAG: TonB C-terminal domain-containing protein [Kangiellaceae bacterium]|nr:TonB C-terminal domain-containing protein [Kangiellaceae bacterium]
MSGENIAKSKDLIKLKSSPVTESDRLRFAIFFALALHFIVIFGVRFVLPSAESSPIPLSLDVTLAHRSSLEAPEDADFIGQNNQIGAGKNEVAERPATELEHFKSTEGVTTTPSLEVIPEQAKIESNKTILTTNGNSEFKVHQSLEENPKELEQEIEQVTQESPEPELLKQLNLEQSINDNIATRGEKEQGIAASVIASPEEAPYLEKWRNKVLDIGNQHYVPISHKLGYGSPTIKVIIGREGQLVSVLLQKSSGNTLIDETAKELIRLAAPYDPLPESVLKKGNQLEFVRRMDFDPGSGVSSNSNK